MTENSHSNPILLLKEFFAKRQMHNPRYSWRAFARDLKLSPAHLINLLHGVRPLTPDVASLIAQQLNLNMTETQNLFLACFPHSRDGSGKKAYEKANEVNVIDDETFSVIADWQHYAILSLGNVKGAKSDPHWIAERLGISVREARASFDRLLRLGFIEAKGEGFKQVGNPLDTTHDIPSAAIRKHHFDHLHKAMGALTRHSVEARYFGSSTFSIDKKDLPEAKKTLRKFRNRFLQKFGKEVEADGVYVLMTHFFSLEDKGD